MNNYRKIATIIIRISAFTFMVSSFVEIGIMSAGILLISLEMIPREALAYEVLFISAVFYLTAGLSLFARSKSLANYIVEGLMDEKEEINKKDSAPLD